jgi:glycerate kinase
VTPRGRLALDESSTAVNWGGACLNRGMNVPPRTVVIAPDKFKGTLTAAQVAFHVATGLQRARPGLHTVTVPVADGGEGTVEAAVAAGYRRVEIGVRGPTGGPVTAALACDGSTAIIEAAQACGLTLLKPGEFAPLTATSRGVGELILAAARMRARRIVLGIGGVATTDGGSGMVRALGGKLFDAAHRELPPGGAALRDLSVLDSSGIRNLAGIEFIVATDVDNPLLGPAGTATVYAPQKGASPADVAVLEEALTRWADVVDPSSVFRDTPGAGAAGGLGFAALAFLAARVAPGIRMLLDLLSFDQQLDGAGLVITGEGALDEQTLHGKAPAGVAQAAAARGVPVVAVAGVCSLEDSGLAAAGIARAYPLTGIEPDLARCRAEAGPLLERLAARIAADWIAPS